MQAFEEVAKSHGFTRLESFTLPVVWERRHSFSHAFNDWHNKLRNDPSMMLYSDDPATVTVLQLAASAKTDRGKWEAFRMACDSTITSHIKGLVVFVFRHGCVTSTVPSSKDDPKGPSELDAALKRLKEDHKHTDRICVVCLEEGKRLLLCRWCSATTCDDCVWKVMALHGRCPLCRRSPRE